jgi:hypothetical protein
MKCRDCYIRRVDSVRNKSYCGLTYRDIVNCDNNCTCESRRVARLIQQLEGYAVRKVRENNG